MRWWSARPKWRRETWCGMGGRGEGGGWSAKDRCSGAGGMCGMLRAVLDLRGVGICVAWLSVDHNNMESASIRKSASMVIYSVKILLFNPSIFISMEVMMMRGRIVFIIT